MIDNVLGERGSCKETAAEGPCLWDVLGVQINGVVNMFLQRCCPVTLPLLSNVEGYTTGQTVPFWQPGDQGPPLTSDGRYQIPVVRKWWDELGPHLENPADAKSDYEEAVLMEPFSGGYRFPFGEYGPEIETIWSQTNLVPVYLRSCRHRTSGERFVLMEIAFMPNGTDTVGTGFYQWNLDRGWGKLYFMTFEADQEHQRPDAGAIGLTSLYYWHYSTHGTRIAIGTDRLRAVAKVDPSTRKVKLRHVDFPTAPEPGAWITKAAQDVFDVDYTSGITTVCYCIDDPWRSIEIERVNISPTATPLYYRKIYFYDAKTQMRTFAYLDVEDHLFPSCYRYKDGRHVVTVREQTDGGFFDGSAFDHVGFLDSAGPVSSGGPCCPGVRNTPTEPELSAAGTVRKAYAAALYPAEDPDADYSFDGSMSHALIGPEGELVFTGANKMMRLDGGKLSWQHTLEGFGSWTRPADTSGASIISDFDMQASVHVTREGVKGWYHVRGPAIGSDPFRSTGLYDPRSFFVGNPEPELSNCWSCHPDGPSVGYSVARQKSLPAFDAVNGFSEGETADSHFVGFDLKDFTEEEYQKEFFAPLLAAPATGDTIPENYGTQCFAMGTSAAPVPTAGGPGAATGY